MNKTNTGANTNVFHILIDILLLAISYAGTVLINYKDMAEREWLDLFVLVAVFSLIYILSNKEGRLYNVTLFYYIDRIQRKVTRSFALGGIAIVGILLCMDGVDVEIRTFLIFLIIEYVLISLNVFFLRNFFEKHRTRNKPRTAYVGKVASFNKFQYFLKKTSINVTEVGYICMTREEMSEEYIGCLEDLESLIREYNIDQVYIMQKNDHTLDYIQHYLDACIDMGVTARLIIDIYKRRKANSFVSSVGTYPIITYHTISLNGFESAIKRCIDILGSLVGIILASPIMLFTAIAIKIDSPGPILFKQTRVGKNGRHFKIYKFRSMYRDAEARKKELLEQNEIKGGVMFKMKDDPRITRVGKVIRKLSIDELPQFFNVLFGSMSLVGTRPPTLDEVDKYERNQWKRISIKPGITGMWQTSGRSAIDDFDKIVELDVEYIDTWTLWLDIKILFKTVIQIFKRGDSY